MTDRPVELDAAWRNLPRRGLVVACRDCGLVHRLTAKVLQGRVQVSAERVSGATRSRRRAMQAGARARR